MQLIFAVMNIAINTRALSANTASSIFLNECFVKLAALYPEHRFIFISANELKDENTTLKNVQNIAIPQSSKNSLLWKYWYNYQLTTLLKKIQADVILHMDIACSLRAKLPQLIWVNNVEFTSSSDLYPKNYGRFMQSNAGIFFNKASRIFTGSVVMQQQIMNRYLIEGKKITVLYPGINKKFQPLNWEQRELVKEKYTGGKEYFFFNGTIHSQTNLINLLKAFSLFKKWQKSNMQLILAMDEILDSHSFFKSLETYKHKADVIIKRNMDADELCIVLSAAYAYVAPALIHSNITPLLNVLQCAVPLIINDTAINKEILGDAAIYAATENVKELADKMMLLFKDEDRRHDIINKGLQHSLQFNEDFTATLVWDNILATIQQS